jgi:hypothetical protein
VTAERLAAKRRSIQAWVETLEHESSLDDIGATVMLHVKRERLAREGAAIEAGLVELVANTEGANR